MASRLSKDEGVRLLGNSLIIGAILYVIIETYREISGAHFNPLVTLTMGFFNKTS